MNTISSKVFCIKFPFILLHYYFDCNFIRLKEFTCLNYCAVYLDALTLRLFISRKQTEFTDEIYLNILLVSDLRQFSTPLFTIKLPPGILSQDCFAINLAQTQSASAQYRILIFIYNNFNIVIISGKITNIELYPNLVYANQV